jgi:hypothetical protein
MHIVRKTVILAAVLLSLFGAVAASPVAEAGEVEDEPTKPLQSLGLLVSTRVVGERSPGTVIQVECTPADPVLPQSVRLGFDANGQPTVAAGDTQGWQIVPSPTGSGWAFGSHVFPAVQTTCTLTEIETGDATEVAWTCNDGKFGGSVVPCTGERDAIPGPPVTTFGAGPGPVAVLIDASDAPELLVEAVEVTFTNTYTPQPVNTAPNFTG